MPGGIADSIRQGPPKQVLPLSTWPSTPTFALYTSLDAPPAMMLARSSLLVPERRPGAASLAPGLPRAPTIAEASSRPSSWPGANSAFAVNRQHHGLCLHARPARRQDSQCARQDRAIHCSTAQSVRCRPPQSLEAGSCAARAAWLAPAAGSQGPGVRAGCRAAGAQLRQRSRPDRQLHSLWVPVQGQVGPANSMHPRLRTQLPVLTAG